jgi:hypothetical protein
VRLLAAIFVVASLLTACASETVHVVESDELDQLYAADRPNRGPNRVRLFMYEGSRLVTVSRTGRSQRPIHELALRSLLSGPTPGERSEGITTSLPPPIELTGISVENRVADVDFNDAFASTDDNELIRRCAQVVYTLADLDAVDSVRFYVNSRLLPVPDEVGQLHSDAVAPARYSRFAPQNPLEPPRWTAPLRIDVRGDEETAVP